MLTRLGLHRELVAYHEHNETEAAGRLVEQVAAGKSVALVSDAGTPAISDPGFRLVRACRRRGLPVGARARPECAHRGVERERIAPNGFFYVGFLPPKAPRAWPS